MNKKLAALLVNVVVMIAFSLVYHFIDMEKHFNLPFKPDSTKKADWFFSTYFSTITHSTAGFGDCYPTTGLSRLLVCLHLWSVVGINLSLL